MADSQQLQNADIFRKILQASDDVTKTILLTSQNTLEVLNALKSHGFSESDASRILNYRQDYLAIESEAEASRHRPVKEKENEAIDKATKQAAGSVGGNLAGIPMGVYSYFFDNPDRYTHEQLKKKADKYAKDKAKEDVKKAKKDAKKAKKKLTDEELEDVYKKAHDKRQLEFHNQYVLYHDKRARELADDPTNTNPYLKKALFYKDTKAAMANAMAEAQKDKSLKLTEIKSLPKDMQAKIPKNSSIKYVATEPSTTTLGPIKTPGNIRPKRSRTPANLHSGRGIPNPLGKLLPKNPLSLLRRFPLAIPITGALISVVFFTAVISFFFFDVSGVAGGTPSGPGGGDGGVGVNPISTADVKKYIIIDDAAGTPYTDSDTEITSKEVAPTEDEKNFIYDTFALPLGSAAYKKLLSNSDGTPRPIYLYFYPSTDSGASVTGGANYGGGDTMRYWGFFEFKKTDPNGTHQTMLKHILIHESGHIIDRRIGELGYNRVSLINSDPSECYNNINTALGVASGDKYMATYAYRDTDLDAKGHHIGGGADQESFAESIANNVYCKPGAECNYTDWRSSTAIVYNRQCGATYDWIKTNIFGGDDFFAPTGTKSNYSFVALGDSLTAWPVPSGSIQTNGVTLTNGSPWPSQLETEEPSLHLTKNAGVPKNTTADMLNRFSTDVTANHPDVLIVLGGTNDAGRGIDTVGNIKQIITNANNAGISKIVVLTIPNQCPPSSGNYSAINTALENLKSATVSVVDITTPLTCGSNYQADGLHLTNEGAKKVADTIDLQLKNEGFFTAGGDTTPNKDTCGGQYDLSANIYPGSTFLHSDAPNFGDPGCTMAGTVGKDHFYLELQRILNGSTTKSKTGEEIPDWILFKEIIIPHESGGDPNDFLAGSSSGNGAYGIYQMNPQGAEGERQYDVGDVNWELQTYNAAMLNTGSCKWRYWSASAHFAENADDRHPHPDVQNFGYNPRVDCLPVSAIQPVQ